MNVKAGSFPHRIAVGLERTYDRLNVGFRDRFGYRSEIRVVPYTGFGSPDHVQIRGRVLCEGIPPEADDNRTAIRNIVGMLSHYKTDEVPTATLAVRFAGEQRVVTSDEEGYFHVRIDFKTPHRPSGLLEPYEVELLAPHKRGGQEQTVFRGCVQIPDAARFGIISDIDDTIVRTSATNFFRHAITVLINNARTRAPFPGVAALYRGLQLEQGDATNPIFYVSSSPWNLYELFVDFMKVNDIPHGTTFLKDFGIDHDRWFKTSHRRYKTDRIEELFRSYRQLGFILIGDSGQHDAEIYRQVVERHPDRVLAVYIRDVSRRGDSSGVDEAVAAIRKEGVPCELMKDSLQAATHAADHGWIHPDDVDRVRRHVYNPDLEPHEERIIGRPVEAPV